MINTIINRYGREYSPYMSGLVNHLPMAQWALYKMTGDLKRVEEYSDYFTINFDIDHVKQHYEAVGDYQSCLGKREHYEACLDSMLALEFKCRELLRSILNNYPLGMSSGLFHTLIRLGYASEGFEEYSELKEEAYRGMAYYVTAFRPAEQFTRSVAPEDFEHAVQVLADSESVRMTLASKSSLGQRMKMLYSSEDFLSAGPVIKGSIEDKESTLLEYLLPLFMASHDIVVLHCITGLHALMVLRDYYRDYERALDIFTTSVIAHLIASQNTVRSYEVKNVEGVTWEEIIRAGAAAKDVHTIKLTYTCSELYKKYPLEVLKEAAIHKIGFNQFKI